MTLKITYMCDTCRSEVLKDHAVAVVFNAGRKNDFTLWECNTAAFNDHKGIHVCKTCLEQYRKIN